MNSKNYRAGINRIAHICSMGDNPNPQLAAIRLAEETSSKCTVRVPPVDVEELCRLRKVTLIKTHLSGSAARLVRLGDRYIAEVNARDPETRRRFSICHEIGHTLFDECPPSENNENLCENSSYESKLEERLCDAIAAELLMPRDVFSRAVRDCRPSMDAIRRVGATFHVSTFAVARRIVNLNLWPMGLLLLRGNERSKTRLRGYWVSRSMRILAPLSIAIKEINSRDWLSGRLAVKVQSGDLGLEYYTYRVPPHFYVCSMLFGTGVSTQ